jgi:hypothetical protein
MTDDEFRALVEAGPCFVSVPKADMLRLLDERDMWRTTYKMLLDGATKLQAERDALKAAIQRDIDEARECNGYSRCTDSYSNMAHSISALRHPDPPATLRQLRSANQ